MAARPPQNDSEEPDSIEFGIAALDGRLDDASFPATADELVRDLDDPEVPVDAAEHTIRLSEALSQVEQDQFETRNELLRALHPVFERERRKAGSGIVGRLKALLPF